MENIVPNLSSNLSNNVDQSQKIWLKLHIKLTRTLITIFYLYLKDLDNITN